MSGLVLLVIALSCVWVGGFLFSLLTAVGGLVLAREWAAMCGLGLTDRPAFWMPVVIVAAALCAGLDVAGGGLAVLLIGTAVAALWGGRLAHPPTEIRREPLGTPGPGRDAEPPSPLDLSRPAASRLTLAFGIPYLGLAAVALPWLRMDPVAGLANTLFVLSIVWASDVGAYLVGRLVGGPKLAPAISPGKTWSGAAGGLLGATSASLAVAACFSTMFSPLHVTELALGLGIISQAGDLFESALKRHFGVKDSGRIIPGHGGLLDRVDALLAVAPVAALLAFTVGRGVVLWR
jgi:phosphatidate cytidylyltransferase